MIHNEEVADFRKLDFITDKDYLKKRKKFMAATAPEKTDSFLSYCSAIINQKNSGLLSIREASYAIATCSSYHSSLNATIKGVVEEAICLRRHPSNYKEDHQIGWANMVKLITNLNKRYSL